MSDQQIIAEEDSSVDLPSPADAPAHHLLGFELEGGWKITGKRTPRPGDTGAYFSVGYYAERHDDEGNPLGERAFVKALDYSKWEQLEFGTPVEAIQALSSAFVFERDIVQACTGRRMANVVRGITSGSVSVPGSASPFSIVDYLVFEIADEDVRGRLTTLDAFDEAWKLRVLHNTANGLRQLHQANFAHQDLKPSNVLCFPEANGEVLAKVGDLGRAHNAQAPGPHAGAPIPGDIKYAPPELLYRQFETDDRLRCRAIDVYHLGSLVTCMFTGLGTTAGIFTYLPLEFYFASWTGDYATVLPYVREAYDHHMSDVEAALPDTVRVDLLQLVRELCDPDPRVRGNPRAGGSVARFTMERYVSILNRLAWNAEIRLKNSI